MNTDEINLKEIFHQHKNKLINAAILILALLFSRSIYEQQLKVTDSLRQRNDNEGKKNIVLENIQQLEKKIEGYKNFVNRKDVSVAMNIISEIAKDFSINVISIKPENPQEKPLFTKYFFDLKLEAANYHDIGKFISKLESRAELYSVENLKIMPELSYDQQKKSLVIDLTLSTILLKD